MKYILKLIADLSFYFTFALIVSDFVPTIFWTAPALLYVVYFIVSCKRNMGREVYYRPAFMLYLLLLGLYMFLLLVTTSGDIFRHTLPFIFLFFASSISLMRFVRYEPGVQAGMYAKLISTVPIGAAFILAVLLATEWFRGVLGWVYTHIFANAILLFGRVIFFIIRPIANWLYHNVDERHIVEPQGEGEPTDYLGLMEELPSRAEPVLMRTAFVVFLVLIALIVLYVLKVAIRSYMATVASGSIDQEYIPLPVAKTKRVRTKNKMRRVYRRFLVKCWKKGIFKTEFYTSDAYEQLAIERFGKEDDLKVFRQLYLPVRYGDMHQQDVAPHDLDFAKKVVSRLGKKR